jgi:hypothetical protein
MRVADAFDVSFGLCSLAGLLGGLGAAALTSTAVQGLVDRLPIGSGLRNLAFALAVSLIVLPASWCAHWGGWRLVHALGGPSPPESLSFSTEFLIFAALAVCTAIAVSVISHTGLNDDKPMDTASMHWIWLIPLLLQFGIRHLAISENRRGTKTDR